MVGRPGAGRGTEAGRSVTAASRLGDRLQRLLQDGMTDRDSDAPTGGLADAGLALDDDRHRDLRVAGRAAEADDPRVRLGGLDAELGGAGLAADLEPGHGERLGAPVLDDAEHGVVHG